MDKYLTLKEKGKPIKNEIDVKKQIFDWIRKNAPKTLDVDSAIDPIRHSA